VKGLKAILSGGMMSTKTRMGRETAKAANAEIRVKNGENAQRQITVGGSMMHWRRDLLLGGNVSVQAPITEETTVSPLALFLFFLTVVPNNCVHAGIMHTK
jgi:hypothetical protein